MYRYPPDAGDDEVEEHQQGYASTGMAYPITSTEGAPTTIATTPGT